MQLQPRPPHLHERRHNTFTEGRSTRATAKAAVTMATLTPAFRRAGCTIHQGSRHHGHARTAARTTTLRRGQCSSRNRVTDRCSSGSAPHHQGSRSSGTLDQKQSNPPPTWFGRHPHGLVQHCFVPHGLVQHCFVLCTHSMLSATVLCSRRSQ